MVLALGLALIFWPRGVLQVFPPLLGALMLVAGAIGIAHSLAMRARLMQPGMKLLQGLLTVLVGLVFLVKQNFSMAFLTVLFGIYVIVTACIHMSMALDAARDGGRWFAEAGEGLLQFVLGALLLFSPFTGNLLWARLLGLHFSVAALSTMGWLLRESRRPHPAPKPPPEEAGEEEQ